MTHMVSGLLPLQWPRQLCSLPILIRSENLLTMKGSSLDSSPPLSTQPNPSMSFSLKRPYAYELPSQITSFSQDTTVSVTSSPTMSSLGPVHLVRNCQDLELNICIT